jgi:hypothetical protein
VPVFSDGTWQLTDELLIHPALIDFWTEHAGRPVMASLLILWGEDQKSIDFCGRWSPTGSQDYMRSHRSVVSALQQRVCKAVRLGDSRLNDWDVIERLERFYSDRSVSDSVAVESRTHLELQISNFLRERGKPEQIAWANDIFFEVIPDSAPASNPTLSATAGAVPATSLVPKVFGVQRKAKFLVIYSKSKTFARLHRTDSNCRWTKQVVKDCREFEAVSPEIYNARCKTCWPRQNDEAVSESSLSED